MFRRARALTSSRFISHKEMSHTYMHTRAVMCIHTTGPKRPPQFSFQPSFPPPPCRYPHQVRARLIFSFLYLQIDFFLSLLILLCLFVWSTHRSGVYSVFDSHYSDDSSWKPFIERSKCISYQIKSTDLIVVSISFTNSASIVNWHFSICIIIIIF